MRTIDPEGNETAKEYAKVLGRLVAVTDAEGGTKRFTYTKAGRRSSVTEPGGARTTFGYDVRGKLASVVSPRGNVPGANPADFTTRYTYDFNNNLVRVSRAYPGGGFVDTDTRYDEMNRPVSDIDALGKVSRTGYDNNEHHSCGDRSPDRIDSGTGGVGRPCDENAATRSAQTGKDDGSGDIAPLWHPHDRQRPG